MKNEFVYFSQVQLSSTANNLRKLIIESLFVLEDYHMDKSYLQYNVTSNSRRLKIRRLLMLICICTVLVLSLNACNVMKKSAYPAEIEANASFKMTVDQTEYDSKVTQISFTIYNDSADDAIFGVAYALEVFQNGVWYSVPFKGVKGDAQPTWPAIAYQLPAHGTYTDIINLSNPEKLLPGSYRLIKDVSIQTGNQKQIILAAQFTISKNTGSAKTDQTTTKETTAVKPVIYLYPTEVTNVSVKLDYNGSLTCTYPNYHELWRVTAYPDGTLINQEDGKEYSYLYWEGVDDIAYDFSKGFVVKGSDTAAFLQEKLAYLGLAPKEYNEFIVYWLPKMQNNPYNLITFQGAAYTDNAVLTISPEPDSMLRVFMVYKSLRQPIKIEEQILTPFDRKGFSVIEWGGSCFR